MAYLEVMKSFFSHDVQERKLPCATTHRHPSIPSGEKKRMRGELEPGQSRKKTAGEWGGDDGFSMAQHIPPSHPPVICLPGDGATSAPEREQKWIFDKMLKWWKP